MKSEKFNIKNLITKYKLLIIIGLFILFIALVTLIILQLLNIHKKEFIKKKNTDSKHQVIENLIQQVSMLDSSNWINFSSTNYGIKIKIPPYWVAVDLPSSSLYPGVVVTSPEVYLTNKSESDNNKGKFSILIRTSKLTSQNNNFFSSNSVGNLGKCTDTSKVLLNDNQYKISLTSFDIYANGNDSYKNKNIFDTIYISSGCIKPINSKLDYSLAPNYSIDKSGIIITTSADFDTVSPQEKGNIYSVIPFTFNELNAGKFEQYLATIIKNIVVN